MNAESFGIGCYPFVLVEDYKINLVPDELAGKGESGGSCAHNDYVGLDWRRHGPIVTEQSWNGQGAEK